MQISKFKMSVLVCKANQVINIVLELNNLFLPDGGITRVIFRHVFLQVWESRAITGFSATDLVNAGTTYAH